jgi:hypothetical protein
MGTAVGAANVVGAVGNTLCIDKADWSSAPAGCLRARASTLINTEPAHSGLRAPCVDGVPCE